MEELCLFCFCLVLLFVITDIITGVTNYSVQGERKRFLPLRMQPDTPTNLFTFHLSQLC